MCIKISCMTIASAHGQVITGEEKESDTDKLAIVKEGTLLQSRCIMG